MSLDAFLKRTMHTAIERVPVPSLFLLERFFGRSFTFATSFVDIDLVMPKRGMAPFVHPLLPGKITAGQGHVMKTYTPPTQKPAKMITPQDLMARAPGKTIYDLAEDQPVLLAALIGEKIAESNAELANRREWMAAQALFSGQIEVVGDGYDDVISFGLPEGHNLELENDARWGQSACNPWQDLIDACTANKNDGEVVSDTVIMGSGAWKEFRDYCRAQEIFNQIDMKHGALNPAPQDKHVSYLGTIRDADMSVDLYGYSASYTDTNGDKQSYVPANSVFVGSTQATGNQVLYGAIQSLYAPSFRGEVFHDSEAKKDPDSIKIVSHSAPLVALLEPKAGTHIKVN